MKINEVNIKKIKEINKIKFKTKKDKFLLVS